MPMPRFSSQTKTQRELYHILSRQAMSIRSKLDIEYEYYTDNAIISFLWDALMANPTPGSRRTLKYTHIATDGHHVVCNQCHVQWKPNQGAYIRKHLNEKHDISWYDAMEDASRAHRLADLRRSALRVRELIQHHKKAVPA